VHRSLIATLALSVFLPLCLAQQQSPDMILLNGTIFTSDSAHPYVQALAIEQPAPLQRGVRSSNHDRSCDRRDAWVGSRFLT
jgi:hypothetical protein